MADIEKVIRALEYCKDKKNSCIDCFYREQCSKTGIKADALALLKEQSMKQMLSFGDGYAEGYKAKDQEIVRCKDCDYKECWGRAGDVVCGINGTPHRPNWFCAYGEPRSTNAPSDTDTTYPVPQSDIATIMNRINEGLDGTGYIAEGYENTDTFLHVLVNREVCGQ